MDKEELACVIEHFSLLLDEYTSMGLIDMNSYDYKIFGKVEDLLSRLLNEGER